MRFLVVARGCHRFSERFFALSRATKYQTDNFLHLLLMIDSSNIIGRCNPKIRIMAYSF